MNCKELKNEVLDCIISANAWEKISRYFGLNEEMLEKYADKLNWASVSQNCEIRWTVKLIEKWADRLDWDVLSDSDNEYLLMPDVIAYFVNRWNWHKLSANLCLKVDYLFIDRFIDRWDWTELMGCGYIYGREFFERYRSHIPMHSFLDDSSLLRKMQEQEEERIKKELTRVC